MVGNCRSLAKAIEIFPLLVTVSLYQIIVMSQTDITGELPPSQLITDQIAALSDWRGSLYTRLRTLVLKAAPNLTEE
jgi:hypothetical protein